VIAEDNVFHDVYLLGYGGGFRCFSIRADVGSASSPTSQNCAKQRSETALPLPPTRRASGALEPPESGCASLQEAPGWKSKLSSFWFEGMTPTWLVDL
jgi:hypothetical protein